VHINKVHHVTTIDRVANDLGESADWLHDIANEIEIEDGVIWVYGVGEDGVMAFTDFGIENLIDLIKMYKEDPALLKRSEGHKQEACGLCRMDTVKTLQRGVRWRRVDPSPLIWRQSSMFFRCRRRNPAHGLPCVTVSD
jgi:hypothetical protein